MPPDTSKPRSKKNFLSLMERDAGPFESYEEQRTKRPLVFRDSDHERHHEALERYAGWCESILVTLSVDFGVYEPRWFLRAWRRTLRRYDELRPGETVRYRITANRGASGAERASAHVIFEDAEPFPGLTILQSSWEAETRGNFVITDAGHRASLYQSKNATEPGAVEEQWNSKLSRAELGSEDDRNDGQRRSEAPSRPSAEPSDPEVGEDPKARWKAEVARRRARNAETRAARKQRRKAEEDALLVQNDGVEAAGRRAEPGAKAADSSNGPRSGRRVHLALRLEKRRVRTRLAWGYVEPSITCLFRDDLGGSASWTGRNSKPVNARGYRHPGRYPILRNVELQVSATVKSVEDDGTVVLTRPYIRLDRQPEATKRAYVEQCGVGPSEVGLGEE